MWLYASSARPNKFCRKRPPWRSVSKADGNYRAFRSLGCFALKRINPGHGSSIHYAGTFPMSRAPGELQTDPDGLLSGLSRTYIGGRFSSVNGSSATNIAAISTSTGALVGTFGHSANGQLRKILGSFVRQELTKDSNPTFERERHLPVKRVRHFLEYARRVVSPPFVLRLC